MRRFSLVDEDLFLICRDFFFSFLFLILLCDFAIVLFHIDDQFECMFLLVRFTVDNFFLIHI